MTQGTLVQNSTTHALLDSGPLDWPAIVDDLNALLKLRTPVGARACGRAELMALMARV